MIPLDDQTYEMVTKISARIEDMFDNENCPVPVIDINKFMLDCLELIQDDCPDVAKEGIAAGVAYCEGSITAKELENARVKCWKYLDKHYEIDDFKTKEVCMIKAVNSALYSEMNSYEVDDTISFFAGMMKRSGVSGSTLRKYLTKHFAQFLE
jgi:hypothetical protein